MAHYWPWVYIPVVIQLLLPRPIGVSLLHFQRAMGARGRTAEMLSTNLLWQAGIPCFSCKWGCSSTALTPVGLVVLTNATLTHRCVGINWCIPHLRPTSAARASLTLSTPAGCPPLPARTFLGGCTQRFPSLLLQGQPRPQAVPMGSRGCPPSPVLQPLASGAIPGPTDRPRLPWCSSSVLLAADGGKTCSGRNTPGRANLGILER